MNVLVWLGVYSRTINWSSEKDQSIIQREHVHVTGTRGERLVDPLHVIYSLPDGH